MIDTLKQTLEELKGKRVKYYTILNYTLDAARSNEPLFIAGSYIYVLVLDGTAKVKLNEISGDDIDLFKYRQIASPFYRIFLTHTAQATKVLSLAVGVTSESFSISDFQSPDMAAMASDISDLKKTQAYNYGTQIAKSNQANNSTVIIHTVSAGKNFLLEDWTYSMLSFASGGISSLKVRNTGDVDQYSIASGYSGSTALNINPTFGQGNILIPEGYDIVVYSSLASYIVEGFIKGREI